MVYEMGCGIPCLIRYLVHKLDIASYQTRQHAGGAKKIHKGQNPYDCDANYDYIIPPP